MHSRRSFLKLASGAAATTLYGGCGLRRDKVPSVANSLVASVRDLGVQFRDNPLGITGQDGATSVRLPDGSSLWLFGDTIEGTFETIRSHDLTHALSNSAALVSRQNASSGVKRYRYLTETDGRRARQIVPFLGDEHPSRQRLWAIHGVCVGEQLYLYYHRITMDREVDVFETFQLDGMGIARARIGVFDFERLTAPDGTREFWKPNVPTYGVFVEQLDDGFIYLWGSLMTGMFLARTRRETIEDLSGYEYLVERPTLAEPATTPRWDTAFDPSAVLFDSVPNEMSASYNPHLKKHVAIHSYNRENKLVMRTAPRITGPWSQPEVFYRPPMESEGDLFYAAKEHPELSRDDGRIIYVTYVNASTYMPHLVEVTLA